MVPQVTFNFEQIKIDQKFISLFASGLSINSLSKEDFAFLKDNTYMVGTNYFPLFFPPHLNIFSDLKTWDWHKSYFEVHKKDFLLCSRPEATQHRTPDKFFTSIDYWFQSHHYKLKGNFTAFWVLQLLKQFFKDKRILLFGWDFYIPPEVEKHGTDVKCKCYDHKTDFDLKDRQPGVYNKKLEQFRKDILTYIGEDPDFPDNIINCNLDSTLEIIERRSYKEVLNAI